MFGSKIFSAGSILAFIHEENFGEEIFRKNFLVRPFLTRNFFQEILGLEGSKISWGEKNVSYGEIFSKNFLRKKNSNTPS